MLDAYLYEGLRTPFGRHGGVLAKVRPDDLLADVMKTVMAKSKFKVEQIEDIVVGCANQGGEDSRCVARHAGLFNIGVEGQMALGGLASACAALALGPARKGATVTAEGLRHGRGDKVIVFKRKRRKGYRKKQGHRQGFTEVRVAEIVA